MTFLEWFGIFVVAVILVATGYYLFFVLGKVILTLLPMAVVLAISGFLGWEIGGVGGGVVFFVGVVIAFYVHDKWEGSELYQKIEKYFDETTGV